MDDSPYRNDREGLLRALREAEEKLSQGCYECHIRDTPKKLFFAKARAWAKAFLVLTALFVAVAGANAYIFQSETVMKTMFIAFDVCLGVCFFTAIFATAMFWEGH